MSEIMGGIRETPAPAWQPIETAPKDFCTTVDLWTQYGRVPDCDWMWPTYGPKQYVWCHHSYDDCNGPVYVEVLGATHWMPLPEPPESSGSQLADATPNPTTEGTAA